MRRVRGRVAVVTGGGSGIGRGMALAFASEGMRLVLGDVDAAGLNATATELRDGGATVTAVPTDVRDPAAVDALANAALRDHGAVHVVCNNAGVFTPGVQWEIGLADWHFAFDVNMWGVVHGIRTFVPVLLEQRDGGHIVNTASSAGLFGAPYCGPYVASKHAVVGVSKALRAEFAALECDIGVSVLCPGPVQSSLLDSAIARVEEATRRTGKAARPEVVGQGNPSKRVPAEDVGRAVAAAVRGNRFWVLPNADEHLELARKEASELFATPNF